jgi:hypothetical protein
VSTYKEQIDAFVTDAAKLINEQGLEAAAEFLPSVFKTAENLSKEFDKERDVVLNDLAEATRLELYGE